MLIHEQLSGQNQHPDQSIPNLLGPEWVSDASFYHMYPLGMLGAPARNMETEKTDRIRVVHDWMDHIQEMGFNAVYLGPVFESMSHGYDTINYFVVDRRLGDNAALRTVVDEFHQRGVRVVVDAVLNHVGRDFPAFRDLIERGQASIYRNWFKGVDFGRESSFGDPFSYEGWHGHFDLVKLDPANVEVRGHLLGAVRYWMEEFNIDGLRLDAADCLDPSFMLELHMLCKERNPDFWLMGEVVHGDYRHWANPDMLDSVTNYEAYKGLWSSLNDLNYFEIDWTLKRQFGDGMYQRLALYNFVDNHDVDRAASILKDSVHLYPLYCLLFSMPGVPSIYYGSEWGLQGRKARYSDHELRPRLEPAVAALTAPHPDLGAAISLLNRIRGSSPALRRGSFHPIYVNHRQMAFARVYFDDAIVVALNSENHPAPVNLNVRGLGLEGYRLYDLLESGVSGRIEDGNLSVTVPGNWALFMKVQK